MHEPVATSASELDKALVPFLRKYAYVDRRNMAAFAKRFCETFNIVDIPRDPITLLPEQFGIEIRRSSRPSSIGAMWMRDDLRDLYVVQIGDYRVGRQLVLSLCHEFFEIMAMNPAFPSRYGDQLCEFAWQFATHFTMPEDAVRAMAAEFGHPDVQDKTEVLASRFNVSLSAMRIRLKALGLAGKRVYR